MKRKIGKDALDHRDLIVLNIKVEYTPYQKSSWRGKGLDSYLDDESLGYLAPSFPMEDRLVLTKGIFMCINDRDKTWADVLTRNNDREFLLRLNKCTSWNKLCYFYLSRLMNKEEYYHRLYDVTFNVLHEFITKSMYTDIDGVLAPSHDEKWNYSWDYSRVLDTAISSLRLFQIARLDKERLLYDLKLSTWTDNTIHMIRVRQLLYTLGIRNWNDGGTVYFDLYNFKEDFWKMRFGYAYSIDEVLMNTLRLNNIKII